MTARSIGELVEPIMKRAIALADFQRDLNAMSPAEQKAAVLHRFNLGVLTMEDTHLLFDVYQLAEA